MFRIPASSVINSQVEITLQGNTFRLGYRWNRRNESWYMTIYKDGEILVSQIKIIPGIVINDRYNYSEEMPQGWFIVPDSPIEEKVLGLDNFGIGKTFSNYFSSNKEIGIS